MERETKILWVVVAGVILTAVLFGVGGKVRQELAPEPRAAWVAIAVGEDPVAVSGPVELAAGQPFTLYAVLEAESWQGETIYYTEAGGLRLDGGAGSCLGSTPLVGFRGGTRPLVHGGGSTAICRGCRNE